MAGRHPAVTPTIRASILVPIVRVLDDLAGGQGAGSTDRLLAEHGLSRAHLRDGYAPVLLRRYVTFLEAAAVRAGDPAFGVRLGAMLQPADLGPAGLLFAIVPTLRQALDTLARYLGTVQGGTEVTWLDHGEWAGFVYQIDDRTIWPRRQDSELTLSTMCSLIRCRLGASWSPLEVHFDHGPDGAGPHRYGGQALRQIFRAPVRFHQPVTQLLIAAGELDRPQHGKEAGFMPALERHAQDILERESRTDGGQAATLADQVRRLVAARVGQDGISVATLADELGRSARSLQRGLAIEGTSLRELLREHRRWMAETRLQAGTASMTQIAHAMGYSDSTVFWRAFKGWSGAPPSTVRRRSARSGWEQRAAKE